MGNVILTNLDVVDVIVENIPSINEEGEGKTVCMRSWVHKGWSRSQEDKISVWGCRVRHSP